MPFSARTVATVIVSSSYRSVISPRESPGCTSTAHSGAYTSSAGTVVEVVLVVEDVLVVEESVDDSGGSVVTCSAVTSSVRSCGWTSTWSSVVGSVGVSSSTRCRSVRWPARPGRVRRRGRRRRREPERSHRVHPDLRCTQRASTWLRAQRRHAAWSSSAGSACDRRYPRDGRSNRQHAGSFEIGDQARTMATVGP